MYKTFNFAEMTVEEAKKAIMEIKHYGQNENEHYVLHIEGTNELVFCRYMASVQFRIGYIPTEDNYEVRVYNANANFIIIKNGKLVMRDDNDWHTNEHDWNVLVNDLINHGIKVGLD